MGACDFHTATIIKGTLQDTFDAVVEQAKYECGHGGYTGTIAEKRSFIAIANCETREDAEEVAMRLIDEGDPRISDKWGPAGAITFKHKGLDAVLFFGWASS